MEKPEKSESQVPKEDSDRESGQETVDPTSKPNEDKAEAVRRATFHESISQLHSLIEEVELVRTVNSNLLATASAANANMTDCALRIAQDIKYFPTPSREIITAFIYKLRTMTEGNIKIKTSLTKTDEILVQCVAEIVNTAKSGDAEPQGCKNVHEGFKQLMGRYQHMKQMLQERITESEDVMEKLQYCYDRKADGGYYKPDDDSDQPGSGALGGTGNLMKK